MLIQVVSKTIGRGLGVATRSVVDESEMLDVVLVSKSFVQSHACLKKMSNCESQQWNDLLEPLDYVLAE